MFLPDLHPGDTIKYQKYSHIYHGTIYSIIDEYPFRSGCIEKCYLTTHPDGFGKIPVRQCEILALDKKPITAV
jgi:hypothetical protein